jgi:WWE domain
MFVSQNSAEEDEEKKGKKQAAPAAGRKYIEHRQAQPPPPDQYRLSRDNNRKKTVTMAIDVPSVWLWLADDESWERFDPQETSKIALALAEGNKGAILHRGDTPYFLDLLRFTQTSVVSGRRRPIYNVMKGRAKWMVQQEEHPSLYAVKKEACAGPGVEEGWVSFSRKETHQLEDAFFAGSDFAVLNRDDGQSCYVDLARWTSTCLTSNATSFIKVTPDDGDSNNTVMVAPVSHVATTTNITTGSSPQQYKKCLSDGEASERTTATALADDDDPFDEDDRGDQTGLDAIIVKPEDHVASSTPRPKSQALWRWHNDSHEWTSFDEDFADALERSWATGASDMVFQRGQTQYYIDLQNLTQTNIDTGRVRPVQRVSQRKKPGTY